MAIVKSSVDNLPLAVVNKLDDSDKGFFYSFKWFVNFIETVTKPMNEEVCFFYDDDIESPVILPVMFKVEHSLRVVKSLTNYYSPIYSILYNEANHDKQHTAAFFTGLKKQLPAWDMMELRPFAFEESDFLLEQLKLAGMPAVSFFCFGNWYLDVNGRSFKEYFASLSSQLKNTVSRKTKKFGQLDGSRVEIITSEQDLAEGMAAYQQVYQSSWKVEEPFPEFMPGLMKLAVSVDGLRLGVAYLGDKPIAAQVWIVADKTAYIFKLAYDEEYKQHSAGTILTTKLMEYVIDVDKVEVVDYLCGDDAYKKDWMSRRRERWGVLVFNTSTVRGCIKYAKEMSKFYMKRLLDVLVKASTDKS
ncbi:MAG: GNAT family N-acetyltransferase [Methylobacter sp.]|nr:GNAT family N-acetyltransferase [Methylobacter sp.]